MQIDGLRKGIDLGLLHSFMLTHRASWDSETASSQCPSQLAKHLIHREVEGDIRQPYQRISFNPQIGQLTRLVDQD